MAHDPGSARRKLFAKRKLVYLVAAALGGATHADAPATGPRGPADWRGLPITFERNDGQHEAAVLFTSKGPHGVLLLRSGELAIAPRQAHGGSVPVKLKLAGANLAPEVEPLRALVTRSHYYVGDAKSHVTNIPHYGELRMKDVYPGIDLDLHGRGGTLEYDFVVAPGADPRDIRLDLRGAERSWIDAQGNLRLEWADQALMQRAPVAFQDGGRAVEARFELVDGAAGPEARIALGAYDRSAPLTIDPVIAYSSYVGASGNDYPTLMAVQASGPVYFAQKEGIATAPIVVTKLDPATNTIIYQTSFGGSLGETAAYDLQLGASGAAYLVGYTTALDFPATPSKLDTTYDGFVARIGASGTLDATHLLGGSGTDFATGVAIDGFGNVYVSGTTDSANFAVTTGQAFNLGGSGGDYDGFVARFSPDLVPGYRRYLGGSGDDYLQGIAVDSMGQVVVVGRTYSPSLPAAPRYGTQIAPFPGGSRGFAAKLSIDGAVPWYIQYVGGESSYAKGVAIDPFSSDALITGAIASSNLHPGSLRPYAGGNDVFVLRLRSDGLPTYATFIGGSGSDTPADIGVDGFGNAYVTGLSDSYDFPMVASLAGIPSSTSPAAFVARLRDGELDFSSQLGGSGNDWGTSLTVAGGGTVWVGGYTSSGDFPTSATPYRSFRLGPDDGFITKITGLDERRTEFTGDFNGDGKSDMVWQHTDGSVAIWLLDGGTLIGGSTIRPAGSGWTVALVADFNGDGRADLLWTREDSSAEIWLMNGTSVLGMAGLRGPAGWWPTHAADFSGDGKADILWRHRNGATELWTMNGVSSWTVGALRGPGTGWVPKLVGDFNGDLKADILWRREDGSATMWLMNGSTLLTGGSVMGPGSWTPTHIGDFNGDGKDDVLWRNFNGSMMVQLMNGTSMLASAALTGPGSGIRATHVADINADGRADIVVRGRGGSLAQWWMNGTSIVNTIPMTNTTSRWVPRRMADFMGNDRAGIVLYDRGTTRIWFTNPDGSQNVMQLRAQGSPWLPFGFDE